MYKIRFYKHFFLFYGDKIIFLSPPFLQILLFIRIFNQVGQTVFYVAIIYRKILVGYR